MCTGGAHGAWCATLDTCYEAFTRGPRTPPSISIATPQPTGHCFTTHTTFTSECVGHHAQVENTHARLKRGCPHTRKCVWPRCRCADMGSARLDRTLHATNAVTSLNMGTLVIKPRAARMLSGCDATTPGDHTNRGNLIHI